MNVGIIGCGAIARRAHIPALLSNPEISVKTVSDINRDALLEIEKRFSLTNNCTDYSTILNDDEIDTVIITTPSNTHHKIAIEAANAGKNILIEKPLCLSYSDGVQIKEAVEDNGVTLGAVFNYRYYDCMKKIKKIIEQGTLGGLVSINGLAFTNFPVVWTRSKWLYHQGGALDDFGPHLIDALLWFSSSNPVSVSAFGGDYLGTMDGCISATQFLIASDSGCNMFGDVSWLTGTTKFELSVHGTGGHLTGDVFMNHYSESHGSYTPLQDIYSTSRKMIGILSGVLSGKLFKGALGHYSLLFEDFFNAVKNNQSPPITLDDALKVVKVTEGLKLSLSENKVVYLEELDN